MSLVLGTLGATALALAYLASARTSREVAETQQAVAVCAWMFAAADEGPGAAFWTMFARRHERLSETNARRAWPYRLRELDPDRLFQEGRHARSVSDTG